MKLIALMAVIFFTLSSNTTFKNEFCSQDARKFVKRKDPPRTHNSETGTYYSEFRLNNISSRKIEVEIELFGPNNNREKKRVTLEPGINTTVYSETYLIKTRRYVNFNIKSAKFIPD